MREIYKVEFQILGKSKWKTLKILDVSFIDMQEAIDFVKTNKNFHGRTNSISLRLKTNGGGIIEWDNF